MKQSKESQQTLASLLICLAFFYLLYHSLAGGTLFAAHPYDSYALQAENWLAGRMFIANGEDYPWLELAIFENQYYLSFPAVPSVLLLPWVLLCGGAGAVPSNFIIACAALCLAAGVYCLFARLGTAPNTCLFWAVFCTMGSNVCWISTSGGVWFMAQICNLCFVAWGLYFACLGTKRGNIAAAAFLALAVGCRPFSILILALFFLHLLLQQFKQTKNPLRWGGGFWAAFGVAFAIGGAMAWYNFARFGSIFEFGRSYLPEFTNSGDAQFSIVYVWSNLKGLFRLVTLSDTFILEFSIFNGFFLFAANPIFLIWLLRLAGRGAAHRFTRQEGVLLGCALAGLGALCMHRTMGGWQFGVRYMVDLIPYILLCEMVAYRRPHTPDAHLPKHTATPTALAQGGDAPRWWEWLLLALAVMFNVYGAIFMML